MSCLATRGQVTSHVRLDDVDFGEMMPFPDAQRAIVSREKICDYLLNTTHPVGAAKAVWFASLGDTLEDWQHLAADLLAVATDCEEFLAKSSPYGVKYEVLGTIGCPGYRPAIVVTVWIVEENNPARLVTAYPG